MPAARSALAAILVLAALLWAKSGNYLLFHSLAELFSVTIATSAFVIAWNSQRFRRDGYLTFLGLSLVAVASLDLLHTLAYKGMGVFPGQGADPPTQLWIAARYLQAASLFAAPFLIDRRPRAGALAAVFASAVALLVLTIFAWDVFPACFVDGQGLTAFKRISEYVAAAIVLGAGLVHWRRRSAFDARILRLLLAAMGVMIVEGLAFTFYDDPYGVWNFVGHCLMILAFFLLYKAVVQSGFSRPLNLLVHDLHQKQEELEQLNETLEERVAVRTAEAEQRALELRRLATELNRAEERERRRLAQVLHDHLQQLLVAAKMRARAAERRSVAEEQRRDLAQLEDILGQSIEATRSLTAELSPPFVYQSGLVPALEWLGHQTRIVHGLEVELTADPAVDALMGEDEKVFLFRATRELIFNAVKHAEVERVRVGVDGDGDGQVVLSVADEGKGYDPAAAPPAGTVGGLGLSSIRERAELLGGSVDIESASGAGTRVRLRVPVAGEEHS